MTLEWATIVLSILTFLAVLWSLILLADLKQKDSERETLDEMRNLRAQVADLHRSVETLATRADIASLEEDIASLEEGVEGVTSLAGSILSHVERGSHPGRTAIGVGISAAGSALLAGFIGDDSSIVVIAGVAIACMVGFGFLTWGSINLAEKYF